MSRCWFGVCVVALLCGCAELPVLPGFERTGVSEKETADQRYAFQTNRDPQALNWLLHNCVRNGLSVAEISRILGESGEREFADRELKTAGDGQYLETDVAFRWGPDSNGRTVVLFFRDGKLVNFNPDEIGS